jgi:uncharacterized membrane protein
MLPTWTPKREAETYGPAVAVLPGVTSGGTLLVAFTLMALGFEYFWVAFVLGFGVVLPTALGLVAVTGRRETDESESGIEPQTGTQGDDETALTTLRRRYAEGKLSDSEFERRVERLLETDLPEDSS